MATKRKRGTGWEYIVKRKGLLPKPWSRTFQDEVEGDEFVAKLEALLDAGIVPKEMLDDEKSYKLVGDVIRDYLIASSVNDSDKKLLNVVYARIGAYRLSEVNYTWVETWIYTMKTQLNLKPGTIRHHVGALARCFDWAARKNVSQLMTNPIRMLPKNYAQYNDSDAIAAIANNDEYVKQEDDERDRRLESGEEKRIRDVLDRIKSDNKERPFALPYQAALELLFDLALETAMRMREIYTLNIHQIDFQEKTIFLYMKKSDYATKVKKLKRQIPLSSVAIPKIKEYMEIVARQERGMAGFNFDSGRLFPWAGVDESERKFAQITSRLSGQFTRIFVEAECFDLKFHDLRHEATSRFFERTKMTESKIMKITGHSSSRMLARYTNLRGSELAKEMW
ncbi:site-specific integrase [Undibacterium sp. RTI2.2]|nr:MULTISPECIES: site-specific integrase [unclassified Undibacterium]MDY7537519.1 site-specific integrase [Undibacterium sp. 5I1]MEB0115425.1 site-specific integrase [Undibacterium sp. RTI2.2]MEB0232900.1 site-specific integrase [Undibacterium sp. 10I3]MEB0256254.1 site-specific integrase [Undibacterium sp. 5I1]